jgi:hypothetical protein
LNGIIGAKYGDNSLQYVKSASIKICLIQNETLGSMGSYPEIWIDHPNELRFHKEENKNFMAAGGFLLTFLAREKS